MKSKQFISKVTMLTLVGATILGSGTSAYAKTRRMSCKPASSNNCSTSKPTQNNNTCPNINTENGNNTCPGNGTGNEGNTSSNSGAGNTNNGGVNNNTGSDNAGNTTGSSSNNNTSSNASTQKSLEDQVLTLVNKERAKYNLSPLTMDESLRNVARIKSSDMSSNKYFNHTSPTYGTPFNMLKSFGISYKAAAENIAQGYTTAEAVVNGWMNSSGHRANILNASYTKIGIGYEANGNYWTQLFIG